MGARSSPAEPTARCRTTRQAWTFRCPCKPCGAPASRSRFAAVRPSSSDRMPRRLEFDEIADLVDALRLLTSPITLVVAFPRAYPLDALRGAKLELLLLVLAHDGVNPANVGVRREGRHQLLPEPGEEIH